MRSVMTILLLLIVLSGTMWYTMGWHTVFLERLQGNNHKKVEKRHGWETGDSGSSAEYGWSWIYGFIPYYGTTVVEQPISLESETVIERPCATDLDCPVGHCSMFGICASGFSL